MSNSSQTQREEGETEGERRTVAAALVDCSREGGGRAEVGGDFLERWQEVDRATYDGLTSVSWQPSPFLLLLFLLFCSLLAAIARFLC
jgi:hypothetical protein